MIYVYLTDPTPELELHSCPQESCKAEHWFPVGEFSGDEKCEVCIHNKRHDYFDYYILDEEQEARYLVSPELDEQWI